MLPDYNYHTHTRRCKHAFGEDREYIEAAIKAGLKILGFSDHCPWVFPDGYVSGMRMSPAEVDDYFHSLESLRKEYEKDIKIFIGFESEYIPDFMEAQDKFLQDYPLDYMILGQHFLNHEYDSPYAGTQTADEAALKRYVDLVIEGLSSGRYLYLAHPDLMNYIGPSEIYEKHMTRLCKYLKENEIPAEINMLGAGDGRNYPSEPFLSIAKKAGCTCIVGIDAHTPASLTHNRGRQLVKDLIQKYSLPLAPPLLS